MPLYLLTGFVKKTIFPYGPTFGHHFKQGKVNRLDPTGRKVVLSSGDEVGVVLRHAECLTTLHIMQQVTKAFGRKPTARFGIEIQTQFDSGKMSK